MILTSKKAKVQCSKTCCFCHKRQCFLRQQFSYFTPSRGVMENNWNDCYFWMNLQEKWFFSVGMCVFFVRNTNHQSQRTPRLTHGCCGPAVLFPILVSHVLQKLRSSNSVSVIFLSLHFKHISNTWGTHRWGLRWALSHNTAIWWPKRKVATLKCLQRISCMSPYGSPALICPILHSCISAGYSYQNQMVLW